MPTMKDALPFLIYYGSFLAFPFMVAVVWMLWKKKFRGLMSFLPLLSLSFMWARFVEPQLLVVREETGPADFVLISDAHLGQYKGTHFLERVVERINVLDPDFVVIPGDFVYAINPTQLAETFAPFEALNMPVYAVLGNHDMEPAGELKDESLLTLLEGYGITWIDNLATIENDIQIMGLGELWNGEADLSTFDDMDPSLTNLVVVHNPDAAYEFPAGSVDLVLAGHTHGGQIRIPVIYRWVVPCKYDWGPAQGWFEVHENPLFITSGLGEIGLPMRLFNPPEIVHFTAN